MVRCSVSFTFINELQSQMQVCNDNINSFIPVSWTSWVSQWWKYTDTLMFIHNTHQVHHTSAYTSTNIMSSNNHFILDAKQILTSSPSVYWKRPPGRLQMTWMKTVQNDLDSHGLLWTDVVDLAQNRPLCMLLATSGATHL